MISQVKNRKMNFILTNVFKWYLIFFNVWWKCLSRSLTKYSWHLHTSHPCMIHDVIGSAVNDTEIGFISILSFYAPSYTCTYIYKIVDQICTLIIVHCLTYLCRGYPNSTNSRWSNVIGNSRRCFKKTCWQRNVVFFILFSYFIG